MIVGAVLATHKHHCEAPVGSVEAKLIPQELEIGNCGEVKRVSANLQLFIWDAQVGNSAAVSIFAVTFSNAMGAWRLRLMVLFAKMATSEREREIAGLACLSSTRVAL